MVEATAYVRRIEFNCDEFSAGDFNQPVFFGIRKDDVLGVYFDQDPMFQFNADGQLRRALVDGELFRAQSETLSAMRRVRTQTTTQLQRIDLSPTELADFLARMDRQLSGILAAIQQGQATVVRCVPNEGETQLTATLVDRVQAAMTSVPRIAPPLNVAR